MRTNTSDFINIQNKTYNVIGHGKNKIHKCATCQKEFLVRDIDNYHYQYYARKQGGDQFFCGWNHYIQAFRDADAKGLLSKKVRR